MKIGKTPSALREYGIKLSRLGQEEILEKLGIKRYKKTIVDMTNAELLKEFGKSAKSLNKSLFIKNVIWQAYEVLKTGVQPFEIGNIRSVWYYVKDTMDRVGANKKGDASLIISNMLVLMVKAGLFKYKDFGFDDDNKGNRWFGKKHPNLIFFSEKTSFTDLLQEVNRDFDMTTIASGGQSSYLSVEYFVDELRERQVDLSQEFIVFSLVDFDPSGDLIATNFIENLMDNGIKNIRIFPGKFYKLFKRKDIFIPENMTEAQRKKTYLLPLKIRKSGLAAKWASRTGGFNGNKDFHYGIENSAMPKPQIMQIFMTELAKIITIDFEAIAKYREMKPLKERMIGFAIKKLQIGS
jgi:hypothetical protein